MASATPVSGCAVQTGVPLTSVMPESRTVIVMVAISPLPFGVGAIAEALLACSTVQPMACTLAESFILSCLEANQSSGVNVACATWQSSASAARGTVRQESYR
jgi:hypothetical protein